MHTTPKSLLPHQAILPTQWTSEAQKEACIHEVVIMEQSISRRSVLQMAAGAIATGQWLRSQEPAGKAFEPVRALDRRSVVALTTGEERRKSIYEALVAIEDQIRPLLQHKKYVLIKPNIVAPRVQLACTHADALRGILDFLAPRFKGPVVIAEASAGDTLEAYDNFRYHQVASEYRSQKVTLLDLNEEAKYERIPIIDADLHVTPVRLAARLFDPDAFILCSAVLKTHNTVVATLSVKNMALGAPLHHPRKETRKWSDKARYHGNVRQTHYDILLTAQKLRPFWGATVIDGFEAMEGNGPASGTPVPSRLAIASTDYVAADRVAIEAMGINPAWLGYLIFCGQCGLGQFELEKIDIRGLQPAAVARKFQLAPNIEQQLQWMGPMSPAPGRVG